MSGFNRLFPAIYLFINGVLYAVVAGLFLANAQAWFEWLSVSAMQPAGTIELRTVYIGLMGSMGIFLIVASLVEQLLVAGVLLSVFGYLGLALVRGVGMYSQQVYEAQMMQLFSAECLGLVTGLIALVCLQRLARHKRNPYF